MKKTQAILLGTALLFTTTAAIAGPLTVRDPYVKSGKLTLGNKGIYEFDQDGASDQLNHEFELDYGVNDFVQLGAGVELKDKEGESLDVTAYDLQAKFQLTPKGKYLIDTGLELSYTFQDDSSKADKAIARLIFGKKFKKSGNQALLNLNLTEEVGANRKKDTEAEIAASFYTPVIDNGKLGLEYFADFGELNDNSNFSEQEHRIGPAFQYKIKKWNNTKIIIGYLVGISNEAPDSTIRYALKYKF